MFGYGLKAAMIAPVAKVGCSAFMATPLSLVGALCVSYLGVFGKTGALRAEDPAGSGAYSVA